MSTSWRSIPGVAVNRSSAITGVDAVCSPPPRHEPFRLPATYMHSRDVIPIVDPVFLSGQWRETDREVGQWGHATREFHEAMIKLRMDGVQETTLNRKTSPPNNDIQASQLASSCARSTVNNTNSTVDNSSCRSKGNKPPADGTTHVGGAAARKQCALSRYIEQAPVKLAAAAAPATVASEGTMRRKEGRHDGRREGKGVGSGGTVGHKSGGCDGRRQRRKSSKAELFMSRLEGNRGPQNRRESIALFKRVLGDCPTANNSAQFRDDICGDGTHLENSGNKNSKNKISPSSSQDISVDLSKQSTRATAQAQKAAAVRALFAQREKSYQNLARLMSVESGSYMLGPEADHVKTSFGRQGCQHRPSPVGVVRVSSKKVV